ncbi:GTPase [Tuwongella immobilis]|uniref:TGS domain-containing protein n=1 Tax=Tuwongella immobilis TaxID=692036 RepID=A0A6C2YLN6_9BACT|nr:GTPase [Tuwongella immobilis]VIP02488.1 small gtp-binding protein : Putative GTPase OS=Singulisphaera acidiphila (strain ATCC BAA-1392 / DSM 18658 / VKM B-2454 / MOB10) GN=Sinac_6637 PE=4 SV=1: MMR_HSR1: TGS [Tuwongella immobilis]VTS01550.1 small gtp-binding protein : Putative GTPase OS=Singulisphaera acidiphila (strain ATCC BAA-1392 / DSM 18658 / VKM B-2454 / MOB10) GN=Sinac_6637 PE=4 SV=1: MMR_HSR1: TGS [Tuwongella immobilis]
MAANLTPQYLEAEEEYRRAKTAAEKLAALKKMWVELPKHKASEKLQADLKTKMSDLRDEVENEKAGKKKGGPSYKFLKQGAGQLVLLGGPNTGKSSILAKLTKAAPDIAPYPFTTREPSIGMMDYEDVRLQLLDTPPITADVMEPAVGEIVRACSAAILTVDLGDDDGPFAIEPVIERLAGVRKELVAELPEDGGEPTTFYIRTLVLGTRIDMDGASDRLDMVREILGNRFPMLTVSLETGEGVAEMRKAFFDLLRVMRIYTKSPGKSADMTSPFTCPIGSTVSEFAGCVHQDFTDKVKSARVWGTGVFDGQTVGRDHVLHDRDVVELQV